MRFVDAPASDPSVCVVTFASFTDAATLDRPGFGEGFFLSRSIPAIHVISRDNRWYQEPDLPAALSAVRETAARYARVIAYGSSMGGFAAIRFGAAAGAGTAIAISPQFSIDPREAAFERRWATHSRRIRFIHDAGRFPRIGHAYVFYDPRDLDARHADLIAASCPTERIRLPYAGHPVAAFLGETGLLTEAVQAICQDRFDAAGFEREARARRRRSGQYLFALGQRVGVWHLGTKLGLARMAVEATPADPVYRSFLGLVLERLGRWPEAEEQYRMTAGPGADVPHYMEVYARALLRRGRIAEAGALVARALSLAPDASRTIRTAALARIAQGHDASGLARLARQLGRDPRHLTRILGEVAAVYRWKLAGQPTDERSDAVIPLPFGLELAPTRRARRRGIRP